jgi:hypothetical protein
MYTKAGIKRCEEIYDRPETWVTQRAPIYGSAFSNINRSPSSQISLSLKFAKLILNLSSCPSPNNPPGRTRIPASKSSSLTTCQLVIRWNGWRTQTKNPPEEITSNPVGTLFMASISSFRFRLTDCFFHLAMRGQPSNRARPLSVQCAARKLKCNRGSLASALSTLRVHRLLQCGVRVLQILLRS